MGQRQHMLNPSFKAEYDTHELFSIIKSFPRHSYFIFIILHMGSLASLSRYVLYKHLYIRASITYKC